MKRYIEVISFCEQLSIPLYMLSTNQYITKVKCETGWNFIKHLLHGKNVTDVDCGNVDLSLNRVSTCWYLKVKKKKKREFIYITSDMAIG